MIAHTKKSTPHSIAILFASGLFLFCGNAAQLVYAASTDIANVPMAVKNSVTPNIAVIYDNSESMDAYMAGTLVSGNDANTRGNIGRQVMRNAITAYRTVFNWGLMSYKLSTNPPTLYNTWAYYLGSNTGMVFTNDCVGYVAGNPPTPGISASNGNNRCVANPQPFTGGSYVTYDKSGDDPDILDALYDPGSYSSLWGLTAGAGTSYSIYGTHNTSAGNSWASSDFSTSYGVWSFTPTDAGYLANNPPMTRQLYLPRGWGYLSNITGAGTINEDVAVDSTTHYNNLMAKLASETNSASSSEIKNGAVYTPLAGSLNSSKTYFSTSYESKTSPIQYSCQQNFVMLVTDGLPTGKTDGSLYSTTERTNTYNAGTSTWTFGTAATDAINSVTALRTTTNAISSTNKDGTGSVTGKYDIQTYVVALGSTVSNTNALAVMDAMASAGGTGTAFLASNQATFQSAIASITNDVTAKTGSAAAVSVANAHIDEQCFLCLQLQLRNLDWRFRSLRH
jgi:type IV pilus assembly protein PilY1